MAERKPWEKRTNESKPAYECFKAYLTMEEPRSVRRLAKELDRHDSLPFRWSSAHEWQARVEAWEVEQDRVWHDELEDKRRGLARRQAKDAARLRKVSMDLLPQAGAGKISDVARALEASAKIARQAHGQGEQIEFVVASQMVDEVIAHAAAVMTPEQQQEFFARLGTAGSQ